MRLAGVWLILVGIIPTDNILIIAAGPTTNKNPLALVLSLLLNTGLPLLVGEWVSLLCGLVFIIAIEVWVYNRFRHDLKESIKEIAIVNIVSTVVGIPLANVARYVLMTLAVYIMPSQIFPHKEEYVWETLSLGKLSVLYLWEHFLLLLFILLVNFFVTVLVEYWVLSFLNKDSSKGVLKRESLRFNSYTYSVIALLIVGYQIWFHVLEW